jgi:hypothetical protein
VSVSFRDFSAARRLGELLLVRKQKASPKSTPLLASGKAARVTSLTLHDEPPYRISGAEARAGGFVAKSACASALSPASVGLFPRRRRERGLRKGAHRPGGSKRI